jgi:hypothetical protein
MAVPLTPEQITEIAAFAADVLDDACSAATTALGDDPARALIPVVEAVLFKAEAHQEQIAVDDLARLMHDADVFVNGGDYPSWDQLSTTPGLGQDEVRKAARYLLRRLSIVPWRKPISGAAAPTAVAQEA